MSEYISKDDVYIYRVPIPGRVKEAITPCDDGCYTIYIDESLDQDEAQAAYAHAVRHKEDFYTEADVQTIEARAHKKLEENLD